MNSGQKYQCAKCEFKCHDLDFFAEHRQKCYEIHKHDIENLPNVELVSCPKCSKRLKQWPQLTERSYRCHDLNCNWNPEKTLIPEMTRQRYACFLCGFDLCQNCVDKKIELKSAEILNVN